MDLISAFITSTTEYKEWGPNLGTGMYLATVVMTLFVQLPALLDQELKIRRNGSAEGLDVTMNVTVLTYFIVFLSYGISAGAGGAIVNAIVLTPMQLWITYDILKLKQPTSGEWIGIALCAALVLSSIILPHKEIFYGVASGVVLLGLSMQPREMLRSRTSKNVALSFPLTFALVSAVWVVYALTVGEWFLVVATTSFTLMYTWIVILWFKFRN